MNNNSFTKEDILNMLEKVINPKTFYMNKNTHDQVIEHVDFQPHNVVVTNLLADNQIIAMDEAQKGKMFTTILR